MKKGRIQYLDLIKTISIILVVFCHYPTLNNESVLGNIIMCLAWAAVPLFFMASGAVMLNTDSWNWKKFFFRLVKIYSLLCIWKLIYLLVSQSMGDIHYSKVELFKYLFLFAHIEGVTDGVLWFMYAYLEVMLISPIIWCLFNRGKDEKMALFVVAILTFISGIGINSVNFIFQLISRVLKCNVLDFNNVATILPFAGYSNMIFYFILGAVGHSHSEVITKRFGTVKDAKIIGALLIVIGACGLMLIKFFYTGTFRWNGIYLTNGYSWISTMFMAMGVFMFFKEIKEHKIVKYLNDWIGRQTMGIYYLHFPLLAWIWWKIEANFQYYSLISNCIKTLLILVVCILVTRLVKKVPLINELVK